MTTIINLSRKSSNTRFMRFTNIAGKLVNPNDVTKNLVMTIMSTESSLRDVFILNLQLMVPITLIYLWEHSLSRQLIKRIIDLWQCVLILDRYLVKSTVVNTELLWIICLLNEQDRHSPRRMDWSNVPFSRNSWSCILSSFNSVGAIRYWALDIGVTSNELYVELNLMIMRQDWKVFSKNIEEIFGNWNVMPVWLNHLCNVYHTREVSNADMIGELDFREKLWN